MDECKKVSYRLRIHFTNCDTVIRIKKYRPTWYENVRAFNSVSFSGVEGQGKWKKVKDQYNNKKKKSGQAAGGDGGY